MSTKKISELRLIVSGNISPDTNVLPIVNGAETFKVTVSDLINSVDNITIEGDLTARSGSFQYVTSSIIDVDANTIRIGGVPFNSTDISNLKEGKPMATDQENMLVSAKDATTKIRTTTTGRMALYAGGKAAIDVKRDKVTLGGLENSSEGIPVAIPGGITGGTSITGSTTLTGSADITGSLKHIGSTNTLPPPLSVNSFPEDHIFFYGYDFDGYSASVGPGSMQVEGPLGSNWDPNNITFFAFSTESQYAFANNISSSNQADFFAGYAMSSSAGQHATIKFTPVSDLYHLYTFKATGVIDQSANGHYLVSVNFVESSSAVVSTTPAPALISTASSLPFAPYDTSANGRFHFTIPPQEEPVGGFNVGDLLNVLSAYNQSSVSTGSLGDYNFDGAVNVTDILTVLQGYANSNIICGQDVLIPEGCNHQLIGPVISVCDGNYYIIASGSVSSITL